MDEGDSTYETEPPQYNILDWIGHSLYLME